MKEKITSQRKEVEDTLACTAFAEAGEPCPIDSKTEAKRSHTESTQIKRNKQSVLNTLEDDFACTAFYDQNEECPI